jgi:uncharacterized membrane protein YhaH (DUF805 family)
MPTKDQILNNIREYSASEIAEAIRCGELSLYELSKSGNLTPLMKKRIEEQLTNSESCDVKSIPEENVVTQDQVHDVIIEKSADMNENTPSEPLATPPTFTNDNVVISNNNDTNNIIDNRGMFKRPFSFKGRIRRLEYCLSYLIFMVWYVIFTAITEVNDINPFAAFIAIISIVPAYWFLWAQGAKRCHDRGNSGWYQIIPFYVLIMFFGKGEVLINDYGTNPKE